MKNVHIQLFVFPIAILLCLASGCAPPEQNVEADVAAIEKVMDQYGENVNKADLDTWVALWAEDGIQMPPNQPAVEGRENIREGSVAIFEMFTHKMVIDNLEVYVEGDMGFARGTYTFELTPKEGGEAIMMDGKYLSILKKQPDGSWKMFRDCFNSNLPLEK